MRLQGRTLKVIRGYSFKETPEQLLYFGVYTGLWFIYYVDNNTSLRFMT